MHATFVTNLAVLYVFPFSVSVKSTFTMQS